MGSTPRTLEYQVSDADRKNGLMVLKATSVRWVSGVQSEPVAVKAYINTGLNKEFTFTRPYSAPGGGEDAQHEIELQKLSIMQQQLEAQEKQAMKDSLNSLSEALRGSPSPTVIYKQPSSSSTTTTYQQPSRPIVCDSRVVFNHIQTNCK